MKKFASLLYILSLLLLSVPAIAQRDFAKSVDRFVATSGIHPESVAVKIIDLSTDKTIASHNSAAPLIPASIMKSVTTASLLSEVGVDFRYITPVYIDGPVDMGIVRGNLIVEGSGDPSLNTKADIRTTDILEEITKKLNEMGINKIEGEIIVDESLFAGPSRPESWQQGDFAQSYGTGFHSLNFEDNSSGRRSVERPDKIFVNRLKAKLRNNGILVDNKHLGEGDRIKILDHASPPVDEIMRSCMMRSDNLYAESMLRTFGLQKGGDGSTADAAQREYKIWKKLKMPLDDVTIIDGSGLSRSNRVTADFMGAMLTHMSGDENYASFFPLAGQEGTLRSFLAETPLDSYIAMKTGSMKGIQCYAGYKLDDDYAPTHAVVIIMNNITGSRDRAKKAAQKMLLEIFSDEDTKSVDSDGATDNETNNQENE